MIFKGYRRYRSVTNIIIIVTCACARVFPCECMLNRRGLEADGELHEEQASFRHKALDIQTCDVCDELMS